MNETIRSELASCAESDPSACQQQGTYRVRDSEISFTDSATNQTTTFPFSVNSVFPSATTSVQSAGASGPVALVPASGAPLICENPTAGANAGAVASAITLGDQPYAIPCQGSPVLAAPVQMNDVSVLYPLPTSSGEYNNAFLRASSPTAQGAPLVPEDVFDTVANPLAAGIQHAPTYDGAYLVGFRLDPCFGQIGPVNDASTCINQLRLVFQEFPPFVQGFTLKPEDGGFHVFYTITRDVLVDALDAIVALRKANGSDSDLGPLAVHPIVAAQGLSGPMAKGLNALVQKVAGLGKLTRVTAFRFHEWSDWDFLTRAFPSASLVAADNIPTLTGADASFEKALAGASPDPTVITLSLPQTTSKDDIRLLLDGSQVEAASQEQLATAYDAALRIENPNFNSPNTIDCASCHAAQIARELIGEKRFGQTSVGDANAFSADPDFVVAGDMAETTTLSIPSNGSPNLHAFSYYGAAPTINTRVINESAAIVAYLNAQTRQSGPAAGSPSPP